MAVYVDDMRAPFGNMIMCHMIADTTDELNAMADRIGVSRRWIQLAGTPNEHYDISWMKRLQAIGCGATPIKMRQLACMCGLRKYAQPMLPVETAEARWKARVGKRLGWSKEE